MKPAPLQPLGDGLRNLILACLLTGLALGVGIALVLWVTFR